MKKRIILIAILLIGVKFSYGQREDFKNMSAEERAQLQTERMTEILNLDSTAKNNVYEINMKYIKQIEDKREDGMTRFDMMKIMEKSNQARNKEMKNILTKDQFKKFMRQQQEQKNRMQEGRGSHPGIIHPR